MRVKVQEFIDAENPDELIHGDEPILDPKTTSHSTTDQAVQAQTQPISWSNYRRYPIESPLPFNEVADQMQSEPQKFYDFLREKKMEDTFEAYFVEVKQDPKKELQELAKENALKMTERLLSQRGSSNDVVRKPEPLPTIDEIKSKDGLIVGKLERIAEYCKTNLSEGERKVILSHFNKLING